MRSNVPKKIILVAILIAVPILFFSYFPIKRKIVLERGRQLSHRRTSGWRKLAINPITNSEERAVAVNNILRRANLAGFESEAADSDIALKKALTRLLTAFARPEGLDFKAVIGGPDFENYRKFRGFDIARRTWYWNTNRLAKYQDFVGTPVQIRKLIPSASSIPGNGHNETLEALCLLDLLSGIFDRPMDPNVKQRAIYCNGHWISIAVNKTDLVYTNISPYQFLKNRPNLGVHSYTPSFLIATNDAPEHLLFSTVVAPDCGLPAHPVAFSLQWDAGSGRWIPVALAAGMSGDIDYIW